MGSLAPRTERVCIVSTLPSLTNRAKEIATTLGATLFESAADGSMPPISGSYHYALAIMPDRLELRSLQERFNPLYIDFNSNMLSYRRRYGGGRRETLIRAVGLASRKELWIADLTAGLGRDAFMLASRGATVTLFERTTVLALLLQDALQRAMVEPRIKTIASRMKLHQGNSLDYLQNINAEKRVPDVLYLDPMYPHRSKHAEVKKEMRILRNLVGDDADASQLLDMALATRVPRVVFKRPAFAESAIPPSLSMRTKRHRFDIYLKNNTE